MSIGIDADHIGHEVIQPDGSAYSEVVERFGTEILNQDGTIDRSRLGRIVFADESRRQDLNQIVHPRILAEEERILHSLEDELSTLRPKVAMVDAALMVETGSYRRYDVILVVYCHQEIQLRRLMTRDGLSEPRGPVAYSQPDAPAGQNSLRRFYYRQFEPALRHAAPDSPHVPGAGLTFLKALAIARAVPGSGFRVPGCTFWNLESGRGRKRRDRRV